MVVEEIKRWIAEERLRPGDKLPKEAALQQLFGVSKGTAREALKSLEVQGLVTVSTGPAGGATIGEVPLDRTFQLVQNYLFFRDLNVAQIYAIRRILEPELAAGAVAHLTEAETRVTFELPNSRARMQACATGGVPREKPAALSSLASV